VAKVTKIRGDKDLKKWLKKGPKKPTTLPGHLVFKKGSKMYQAPRKSERFGEWYVIYLGIGKDHSASLYLHADAVAELKKKGIVL